MDAIPVMVTGVGGGGHGEQILKALRLANTPYEIVGTDMSPFSSGLVLADHAYIVPPASDPQYLEIMVGLCRKHSIKALFHGSEPELKALSSNRERFSELGVFLPINPRKVLDICMDKAKTCEFLEKNGFLYPEFRRVRTVEDAISFEHLPAVLKPSVGGGGSANVFLVQDKEMMRVCAAQVLKIHEECIVQSYVGRVDEEYTVGVLHDMEGNFINSIAVRRHILSTLSNRIKIKNWSGRRELGETLAISNGVSQGEIGRFPEVTEYCEKIAAALGAKAAINIQCRLVSGQVYVFEINPRFSGTTSLRAMVGYNEPDILIRKHILGDDIPAYFPYRSGRIVRSLTETFIRDSIPLAAEVL